MEINEIRPFLLNTLYAFTKINIAERIQIDIASNMQHYSSSQNYMTDSKDEKYKKVEFDPLRAFNTSILPSIMSDSLSQTFHSPVDELESFEQLLKRP